MSALHFLCFVVESVLFGVFVVVGMWLADPGPDKTKKGYAGFLWIMIPLGAFFKWANIIQTCVISVLLGA